MSDFVAELLHRISDARQALQRAQAAGETHAERVYSGELDSLYHLAKENGIPPPDTPPTTAHPTEQDCPRPDTMGKMRKRSPCVSRSPTTYPAKTPRRTP